MPIDFSSLQKMELPAFALAGFQSADEQRGAIVRLHEGAAEPRYIKLSKTAGNIYTTKITPDQWNQLKADPAVADVRLSEIQRLIK